MDKQKIASIPTEGPRGIQFSSRLEAKWAYLFESFGWDWEYEPIDIPGYIPDFIIKFGKYSVLVEVKPEDDVEELKHHIKKILKSGWKGSVLVVGNRPLYDAHKIIKCPMTVRYGMECLHLGYFWKYKDEGSQPKSIGSCSSIHLLDDKFLISTCHESCIHILGFPNDSDVEKSNALYHVDCKDCAEKINSLWYEAVNKLITKESGNESVLSSSDEVSEQKTQMIMNVTTLSEDAYNDLFGCINHLKRKHPQKIQFSVNF